MSHYIYDDIFKNVALTGIAKTVHTHTNGLWLVLYANKKNLRHFGLQVTQDMSLNVITYDIYLPSDIYANHTHKHKCLTTNRSWPTSSSTCVTVICFVLQATSATIPLWYGYKRLTFFSFRIESFRNMISCLKKTNRTWHFHLWKTNK